MDGVAFSVSDFVAVFNQTIEYAYPSVTIVGELANYRVSKNRWVYFDLKDENASIRFFGTVYQLPGPLEDGMLLQVVGTPRLHPLYGFSITVQSMQPVGEGSLKRAAALLEAKLRSEGLFDESRKRPLPYPPGRVGLITSGESAAFHDFMKILNERWGGIEIELADVQVQGERAPGQLIAALEYFNTHEDPVDVLVMTRGGGSAEDLAAFNHEQLTRSIAASRIPTIVAIGHEVDVSLAELAADQRASTPSNAAQLLVPDKQAILANVQSAQAALGNHLQASVSDAQKRLQANVMELAQTTSQYLRDIRHELHLRQQVLAALSPTDALRRGYAVLRSGGNIITSAEAVSIGDEIDIELQDGRLRTKVYEIEVRSTNGTG